MLEAFEYGAAAARRDRDRHRPLGGALLAARRTSARSWRSRRPSRGRTSCSTRRRRPTPSQLAELGLRLRRRARATRERDGPASDGSGRRDRRCRGPSRRSRTAPARGAARGDVHRVLGDLLPLRRGHADDRHRLPLPVRAAVLVAVAYLRAAALRPAAGTDDRARARSPGCSSPATCRRGTTRSSTSGPGLRRCSATSRSSSSGSSRGPLFGERPPRSVLLALPIVLVGVVLISGVIGGDAYGSDPVLGVVLGIVTALCYAGYLLVIRRGGARPAPARPARSRSRRPRRGDRRDRRARRSATSTWLPAPAEPRLARAPRAHVAVGRLPADLDLAAAAAGRAHLDHPARPAGRDRRPLDGPAWTRRRRRPSSRASALVVGGHRRRDARRSAGGAAGQVAARGGPSERAQPGCPGRGRQPGRTARGPGLRAGRRPARRPSSRPTRGRGRRRALTDRRTAAARRGRLAIVVVAGVAEGDRAAAARRPRRGRRDRRRHPVRRDRPQAGRASSGSSTGQPGSLRTSASGGRSARGRGPR